MDDTERDEMIKKTYETLCVSTPETPCVVEQLRSHGTRIKRAETEIKKNSAIRFLLYGFIVLAGGGTSASFYKILKIAAELQKVLGGF